MEVDDVVKVEGLNTLRKATSSVVAIAISGSKKSKNIIKWAIENFLPDEGISFKLLHVYPQITTVPTPLGTSIPISQVRDDVATAFKKEVEWQTNEKITPYKTMFTTRKLQVEIVQIQEDDVAKAIGEEVLKCNIKKLVIGSSSMGMFSRGQNWSSKISGAVPSYCTVYVVSKGKLSSIRPAATGTNGNIPDDQSDTSSTTDSSSNSNGTPTDRTDRSSTPSTSPLPRFQVISTINQTIQQLFEKGRNLNETTSAKILSYDSQEGKHNARFIDSFSEVNDTNGQTLRSNAPSSSRTMKRYPDISRGRHNPFQKRTSSSPNIFPEVEDAGYAHRNSDASAANTRASYSQKQSPSPPSQRFHPFPSRKGIPPRKATHLAANMKPRKLYLQTGEVEHDTNTYTSITGINPSAPTFQFQALSLENQTVRKSTKSNRKVDPMTPSHDTGEREEDIISNPSISSTNDINSQVSSFRSPETDGCFNSWITDQTSTAGAPTNSSSGSQDNFNLELERLKMELKHMQGMYAIAQNEVIHASQKLNNLQKSQLEEIMKLKEEQDKEIAKQEKEIYESAKKDADYAKERAVKEAAERKQAENMPSAEFKEKEKLENTLVSTVHQYQKFSWDEITSATESFSENYRVGMGSFGTVYKCSLRHTAAAVKVLHSMETHRKKQFQQELEILSKIHHPHLLTLLGACPERSCLVYEYMENGSLEERLLRKQNTPPLPWFARYRIAHEVASALVFLHSSKPKPIIHRDLKPANILLDNNLVSKIGDVGLSTIVQLDSTTLHTIYKDTSPVGTLCYIDPEYQRTGTVSPKSDIYALGMVILQLLTAKPAIALTHTVEEAIEDDQLLGILDPEAGEWPLEETKELAVMALKCTEIRRKDRPDLKGQVLPLLEKLKLVADKARDSASNISKEPPTHFICPLLKDVMYDPCVAADGYTYDRKAIEAWLGKNNTSPMTNAPLPHKHLLPNHSLTLAITEWRRSGKQ